MDPHYERIKAEYQQSVGDFTQLYETLLATAEEVGLDQALAHLESCIIEKRLAWLDKHLAAFERTEDPVQDGYRLFYETYLGVSTPPTAKLWNGPGENW